MASSGAIRPSMGAACRSAAIATAAATTAPLTLLLPTRRVTSGAQARPLFAPSPRAAGISTTAVALRRHTYDGARMTRDNNKVRGESALRKTGGRWRVSVSDEPLPKPVPTEKLPPVQTDPNHGLWEFFADRSTVTAKPLDASKHGRGWTAEELRFKSWEDLHRLWWVCVKERNRISTSEWERRKSSLGFGETENRERNKQVAITMNHIRHVLTERFYAYEDARTLAETDPEVNLSGDGPAFTPMEYLEEEPLEDQELSAETETKETKPVEIAEDSPALPQEPKSQGETVKL